MDLEVREIPIQSRAMYNSRLKSYKQEVEKLEKDFVSTFTSYNCIYFNHCKIGLKFVTRQLPHFCVQFSTVRKTYNLYGIVCV